jgi:general secretion pathway protein E/type IV pilus assembly protein PilB
MLGSILVELGFITESALGEILAESTGIEKFDAKAAVLDPNLIKQIPKNIASRHKLIPISLTGESVHIAMADVYNVLAIDQVQRYFPKNFKIIPVYCAETEILELIDHYYDYEMSIDGVLREIETGLTEKRGVSGEVDGYVNPTVRLVDALLVDAIKCGASDIHFEPEGAFLRLRYRIDGQMQQIRSFHNDYWPAIAVRIKILSGMNIAETRNPQDGRISYNVLGREVDFRVAAQPTIYGENIVMRILDRKKALLSLDKLGFSEHNEKVLKKLLKRPEGIIIVTGPTGSGKTTSLYSILGHINSINVNIMTLEDPVEYQLPMIRQSMVREGSGMNFNTGIRAMMRQDPDIIFVGEVRDEDTANMALRAAMTGHQVFTTLHTNDALGAIPRLIDIGIQPRLLAGSLICCMAQRLARKLCPHCKTAKTATAEECKILGVSPENPPQIYEHQGCDHCSNNGYKGRIAIAEILPIDRAMDEFIAQNSTRKVMMDYALSQDFIPMIEDGVKKVLAGVTDLDELINTIDMTERL